MNAHGTGKTQLTYDGGETKEVTIEMFPAGTFSHPKDPMATNQVDPAGASTEQDAIRLAQL